MRMLALAASTALALSACTEIAPSAPLLGPKLEARLSGQVLSMTPVYPELGTPTRALLNPNGIVQLSYADGRTEQFKWRVEGQGLCFSGRGEPNRYYCCNVLVSGANRVSVYDTTSSDAVKIANGRLSPI